MEKIKMEISESIDLANLENESLNVPPQSCSGNACSVITLQATFHTGAYTVRSITIKNSSPKKVKVTLDWADPFGYCGVSNSDTIEAGGSVEFLAPTQYNPGYCKVKATFN